LARPTAEDFPLSNIVNSPAQASFATFFHAVALFPNATGVLEKTHPSRSAGFLKTTMRLELLPASDGSLPLAGTEAKSAVQAQAQKPERLAGCAFAMV